MAQGDVPTKPPTFITMDWGAMMRQSLGDDVHKRETAYEFNLSRDVTQIRRFEDSGGTHGLYAGVHPGDAILQEDGYELLQQDGSELLQE